MAGTSFSIGRHTVGWNQYNIIVFKIKYSSAGKVAILKDQTALSYLSLQKAQLLSQKAIKFFYNIK